MIYEQKVEIPSSTHVVKHEVAPCLICGFESIKIEEYENQYGSISTATCQNCYQKIRDNVGDAGIVKLWNERNDIDTLLAEKASLLARTKNEIMALKDLQKQRKKGMKRGIAS